jgi:hypothetical protein
VSGYPEVLEALLAWGGDVNARQRTPSYRTHLPLVHLLASTELLRPYGDPGSDLDPVWRLSDGYAAPAMGCGCGWAHPQGRRVISGWDGALCVVCVCVCALCVYVCV